MDRATKERLKKCPPKTVHKSSTFYWDSVLKKAVHTTIKSPTGQKQKMKQLSKKGFLSLFILAAILAYATWNAPVSESMPLHSLWNMHPALHWVPIYFSINLIFLLFYLLVMAGIGLVKVFNFLRNPTHD